MQIHSAQRSAKQAIGASHAVDSRAASRAHVPARTLASVTAPPKRDATIARSSVRPVAGPDFAHMPVRSDTMKPGPRAPTAAWPLADFPHRATIERGLDRRIPGRAVVDSAACTRLRAPAFTNHNVVSFAEDHPPLRVAAHEAAHLVQHSGQTRDLGASAEGHAQLVADAIERGRSARDLIRPEGASIGAAVRTYTDVPVTAQKSGQWDAKGDLRVSDDGRMAVREDEEAGGHNAWAESAVVAAANTKLSAAGSVLKLNTTGGTLKGKSASGEDRTLSKVEPENTATKTKGATMELWADCGRSGRDVMGAGGGTGGGSMVAVFRQAGAEVTTAAGGPAAMKNEVMRRLMGGTVAEAWGKYFKLSTADRRKIDEQARINAYAQPGVGQGYTISSGGADYPGASTWNFHWAGVVMASGPDRVTLENFATGDPAEKNTEWDFQMYGSAAKAGQTFFEQHKATKQHGQEPTAMAVQKQ